MSFESCFGGFAGLEICTGGYGSIAGFRGATFETSRRLSKPLDFRPQIAVANVLTFALAADPDIRLCRDPPRRIEERQKHFTETREDVRERRSEWRESSP